MPNHFDTSDLSIREQIAEWILEEIRLPRTITAELDGVTVTLEIVS